MASNPLIFFELKYLLAFKILYIFFLDFFIIILVKNVHIDLVLRFILIRILH